ncbi:MAG: lysophospholipid acyltransferase family protein [Acidobacteriota bacterium]|nr:lysophospholipid acyltransferase family protein [Acidobacteriota bacterium]
MSSLPKVNAIWRVPLILSWTALMAILSVSLSLWDTSGSRQHWCARTWSRFILLVSRVKVEVSGLDKLDPSRGYLFAANHLSMFDHWAFLAFLPGQFRFLAKASLFQLPFLGWHLRRSGNIAVDRHQPRKTLRVFRRAAKKMEAGLSFVVYPEGARTWGDEVLPFKRGSLLLARYASAPIVPVTLIGAHRRLVRGSILIVPGKMQMIIHSPIEFDQYQPLEPEALADTVRQTIIKSYHQVS